MKLIINMDETVKVKLTDDAILLLKKRNDQRNENMRKNNCKGDPFKLELDADGYYTTTLWNLFIEFGGENYNFANPYFKEIKIEK